MNLFNLVAKLGLDKKDYEKGLNDAGKEASSFASKAGTVMKGAAKAFAAVSGAVVAASAAVLAFGKKMVDLGGDIDDNAQRLGMSTDQYQLWSFAMTKAGTDVSTLQRGMIQLSAWTENLSNGQADALKTLDDLGIGYEEFMALDTAGQLEAVTNALQGMTNQTDKANLAQQLFGDRTAQQMMPLFNEEQGSIEKLNDTLREQGVIIGEDNIQAAAKLGDSIDLLKATFTSFGLKLATDAFPEVNQLISGLQGLATGSEDAADTISNALIGLIDKVVEMLPTLIDKVVNLALDLIKGIVPMLPKLVTELIGIVLNLVEAIVDYLPELISAVFDIVEAILNGLLNADNLVKLIECVFNILTVIQKVIFEMLPNLILALVDKLVSLFTTREGLEKLKKIGLAIAQACINGLIAGVEGGLNLVIQVVNKALDGLSKAWTWLGIPSIPHINNVSIPRVKFYKDGGMFDELSKLVKGTAFAVAGEDGAEIVAQGRNGTGVANVEQIADAQYMALKDYRLNETITASASAIVNGIVSGINMNRNSDKMNIVVQIGEKDFKSYIIKTVNETLNAKGRKNLNAITSY